MKIAASACGILAMTLVGQAAALQRGKGFYTETIYTLLGTEMKRAIRILRVDILLAILLVIILLVIVVPTVWSSISFMILQRRLAVAGLPADALKLPGKGVVILFLRGPDVVRLPNLSGARIYDLRIENTNVEDLSPLRSARLSEVSLKGSPVSDISPLSRTGVRFIDLLDTSVTDLSPLAQMEELRAVRIPRKLVLQHLAFLKSLAIFVHTETDNSNGGLGWYKKYERMSHSETAEQPPRPYPSKTADGLTGNGQE